MQEALYHQFAAHMDRHWWPAHRRALAAQMLAGRGIHPNGRREVLEIGSGAGNECAFLSGYGPVTGVEVCETGLAYCRPRPYARLLEHNLNDYVPAPASFDLVVDFNVLYHRWVREPEALLQRLRTSLRPGGHLLLTEPAFELFRRELDRQDMGARRWDRAGLGRLLRRGGFAIVRFTAFTSLFAPLLLVHMAWTGLRGRSHPHGVDELEEPTGGVNAALRAVAAVERVILRAISLPLGTTWMALARPAGRA